MANGTVVVVGGTQGLGRELAHAYARDSRESSPFALIPISPTIQPGTRGRLMTDMGNPIALF